MVVLAATSAGVKDDHPVFSRHSLMVGIGVRTPGLLSACLVPLGLTMVLFLGPLAASAAADHAWLRLKSKWYFWRHTLTDWIAWRNYVVAPFTEEFTFR